MIQCNIIDQYRTLNDPVPSIYHSSLIYAMHCRPHSISVRYGNICLHVFYGDFFCPGLCLSGNVQAVLTCDWWRLLGLNMAWQDERRHYSLMENILPPFLHLFQAKTWIIFPYTDPTIEHPLKIRQYWTVVVVVKMQIQHYPPKKINVILCAVIIQQLSSLC